MALGADQTNQPTNNLVFIKHHHQLHIGKNVSDELSILAPQSRMALRLLCLTAPLLPSLPPRLSPPRERFKRHRRECRGATPQNTRRRKQVADVPTFQLPNTALVNGQRAVRRKEKEEGSDSIDCGGVE
jgi:hypothetical protein